MEDEIKKKKEYEIGLLLKNESAVSVIKNIVKDFGGEVVMEAQFNKIYLSYQIKKNSEAFFGYMVISADADAVGKISKEIKLFNECLRHIIVKYVKPETPMPTREDASRPYFSQERKERRERKTTKTEKRSMTPLTNEELEKKLKEILK